MCFLPTFLKLRPGLPGPGFPPVRDLVKIDLIPPVVGTFALMIDPSSEKIGLAPHYLSLYSDL